MARKSLMILSVIFIFTSAIASDDAISIADFSTGADSTGIPKGWELKEKSGKADFAIVKDGDIHAVHLKSSNTSFSFQKAMDIDIRQYPILTWKWKAVKLPAGGDFRKSSTDDQTAQLFIAFSKTKAIVYIWDTTAPEGMIGDAAGPFFMHIKAVVVRSGRADLGRWLTETRNVYEDYKKIFGEEPPHVQGVRLQINSQHTGTSAESFFADVAFKKP